MTDVNLARENIQIEEVQYRASISEAVGTKLGGSINFINEKQYDTHSFLLNGPYALGAGSIGTDGIFPVLYNMELIAVTFFNVTAGLSGTTTLDVHWLSSSGVDQGSIFGTKALIDQSAANNAYAIKGIKSDIADSSGTGIALPTMVKTEFDAGNALRLDLDTAMFQANNAGLLIHFRPRD